MNNSKIFTTLVICFSMCSLLNGMNASYCQVLNDPNLESEVNSSVHTFEIQDDLLNLIDSKKQRKRKSLAKSKKKNQWCYSFQKTKNNRKKAKKMNNSIAKCWNPNKGLRKIF